MNQETFDRVKLQFTRLNNMWSPKGDTFCHQAEYHLRHAVICDGQETYAVAQLCAARDLLARAYMEWNRNARDYNTDSWNSIYGAACHMLDSICSG